MSTQNLFNIINQTIERPLEHVTLPYLEEMLFKTRNIILTPKDKSFLQKNFHNKIPYNYILYPEQIRAVRINEESLINASQLYSETRPQGRSMRTDTIPRVYQKVMPDNPYYPQKLNYFQDVVVNPLQISTPEAYADEAHTRDSLQNPMRYPEYEQTYKDNNGLLTLIPQFDYLPEPRVNTDNSLTNAYRNTFNITHIPRPFGKDMIVMTPKLNINNIKQITIYDVYSQANNITLEVMFKSGSVDIVKVKNDHQLMKMFRNDSPFPTKPEAIQVDLGNKHIFNNPVIESMIQNQDARKMSDKDLKSVIEYYANPPGQRVPPATLGGEPWQKDWDDVKQESITEDHINKIIDRKKRKLEDLINNDARRKRAMTLLEMERFDGPARALIRGNEMANEAQSRGILSEVASQGTFQLNYDDIPEDAEAMQRQRYIRVKKGNEEEEKDNGSIYQGNRDDTSTQAKTIFSFGSNSLGRSVPPPQKDNKKGKTTDKKYDPSDFLSVVTEDKNEDIFTSQ